MYEKKRYICINDLKTRIMEEAAMVLMLVMLVGIYILGCAAVAIFITKNTARWLKR